MRPFGLIALVLSAAPLTSLQAREAVSAPKSIAVTPAEFTLVGGDAIQRLVTIATVKNAADGCTLDLSRKAVYVSAHPAGAVVSAEGGVRPRGNGTVERAST